MMSKRHFFLYDFLLPLLVVLAAGVFLARQFDADLLRWLDTRKTFGIGAWFAHSPLRRIVWNFAWLFCAVPPALLWLLWARLNLEYDWVARARRLDRPIFNFARGFFLWVEGGEGGQTRFGQLQSAQFRAAQAEDRSRRLEGELAKARRAYADLEADYGALEDEAAALEELEGKYQTRPAAG